MNIEYSFNNIWYISSRKKKQLDLSYCENSNVQLNIPVLINENNLEKYNLDCDFYNNIFKSYTNEKGLDVTIFDRKKEYIFICFILFFLTEYKYYLGYLMKLLNQKKIKVK